MLLDRARVRSCVNDYILNRSRRLAVARTKEELQVCEPSSLSPFSVPGRSIGSDIEGIREDPLDTLEIEQGHPRTRLAKKNSDGRCG